MTPAILRGNWELVGHVDVDSGLLWIGDPCYVVKSENETQRWESWDAFCKELFSKQTDANGHVDYHKPVLFGHTPSGGGGLALCTGTAYGDGSYPVYVLRDGDRCRAICVDTDPGEDA